MVNKCYTKRDETVIDVPIWGTNPKKTEFVEEHETSNEIKFTVPSGCKTTITIEDNSNRTESNKKVYINHSISGNYNDKYNHKFQNEIISTMYIEKIKEEEAMKREVIKSIHYRQIKFLLISMALIIFALVGLFLFSAFNLTIIHPALYIFIGIMGIGWGTTSIAAIFDKEGV